MNPNNIATIKQGHAKLALDRVAALARALDVDPGHLFNLALEQAGLEATAAEVAEIFGVVARRMPGQDPSVSCSKSQSTRASASTWHSNAPQP